MYDASSYSSTVYLSRFSTVLSISTETFRGVKENEESKMQLKLVSPPPLPK